MSETLGVEVKNMADKRKTQKRWSGVKNRGKMANNVCRSVLGMQISGSL